MFFHKYVEKHLLKSSFLVVVVLTVLFEVSDFAMTLTRVHFEFHLPNWAVPSSLILLIWTF